MNDEFPNIRLGESLNVLPPDAKEMIKKLVSTVAIRLYMVGADRNSPEGIEIAYQVFKEHGWWKEKP
ncbi:MAG: hypothetical protein WA109_00870 [Bellilinea sp.]